MSLPVLIGFAGVLVAAAATGMLAGRCARQPRIDFILWTAATLALTAALAAQSLGFASGFSPATFRAVQLFGLLLAPLWLAWGLAELAWPSETARFGARLICGAVTVVGGVILATDPLTGQPFSKSWPLASEHYQPISHYVLDLVQALAVVIALVSAGLAAARARNDRQLAGTLAGTASVGLAVLMATGLRFSLPAKPVYPLLDTLAAALVWFGATRVADLPGRAGRDLPAGAGEPDGYDLREARYATNGHARPADPGDLQDLHEFPRGPAGPAGVAGPGRPGAPYGGFGAPRRPGQPRVPAGPSLPGGSAGSRGSPDGGPGIAGDPGWRADPRPQRTAPGPGRYRGAAGPGGTALAGPGPARVGLIAAGPDGRPATPPQAQRPQLPGTAVAAAAAGPGLAGAGGNTSGHAPPAESPAAAPARPYGRIVIFTLLEDRVADFDRLAEQTAEEVRTGEPDTLVFVIHLVPNAPLQRIFYEIYRDRAAFDSHESQSYMERFVTERRSCVLATNVIELRLKYAKIAPLPSRQSPSPQAASSQTVSPQTASSQTASRQTVSPQMASSQTASRRTVSSQTVSPQTASPQTASPQTASPQTASPQPSGLQPVGPQPEVLKPLPPGPSRRLPAADRRYGGT